MTGEALAFAFVPASPALFPPTRTNTHTIDQRTISTHAAKPAPPPAPPQSQEGPGAWQAVTEAGFELRNALEMAAALVTKAGRGPSGGAGMVKALFSGAGKERAKAKEKFAVRSLLRRGGWLVAGRQLNVDSL